MNKYNPADYPGAERYYASALSLPMYFDLKDSQVHTVAAVVGS
jgi:dTDP-4-amino-4,6-dideoxygalactose transaminase